MRGQRVFFASLFAVLALCSCAPHGSVAADQSATKPIDFNRDVRPILSNRCFRCHGPDAATVQAGLRLDSAQTALAPLDSGQTAIVPGKPGQSELIARVFSTDDGYRMPPPATGDRLSAQEKEKLEQWVQHGAIYESHWSFVPPTRPALPNVSDADFVRNPIDRFVLSRLDAEGLQPSPSADRFALARRATLDLTGLPPTLDEVDRFVNDSDPQAYEHFVDRLLDWPAYGEQWASVWLDLARFADSAGYAQDPPRTIWKYRDWVIRAINANMPFDQFTIEQLAGDLLPDPTEDQLIATAFHRNTMTNSEGGTDDEEFRNAAIVDRVNTTMQVWMGLTMACAQCHNHKYDPVTQEEYFQFFAIFNNTADADRGDESPTLTTFTDQQRDQRKRLQAEIADLEQRATKTAQHQQLAQLKKELDAIGGVTTPVMRELPADERRRTFVQIRGNFLVRGQEVAPGVPAAFFPLPNEATPDRLAAAGWLVDDRNPLTARVTVNRFWEHLFGIGLVETSEDFGRQGALPSHPALLDYLATELMSSRWDTKALVRMIVTSGTYRQSSRVSPQLRQRDPGNRLLARGPRFRLSAEKVRDQALAVAGLLSHKMYGPSVRPPRPALGLRAAFGGSTDWETSTGEDRYRRGLYTSWRRTTPYPSLTTFDAPSREFCAVRRLRTNTPLQALVTMNDPVYVEASQALARRIVAEGGTTVAAGAEYGFRLCLSRPPTAEESRRLVTLWEETRERFLDQPDRAQLLATDPLGPAPPGADVVELAAWTVLANVLLNLDEFLARR